VNYINTQLPFLDFAAIEQLHTDSSGELTANQKLHESLSQLLPLLPEILPNRLNALLLALHQLTAQREATRQKLVLLLAMKAGHAAMRALPPAQCAEAYALLRTRMQLLANTPQDPEAELWAVTTTPVFAIQP
jgi:hypothetical protein